MNRKRLLDCFFSTSRCVNLRRWKYFLIIIFRVYLQKISHQISDCTSILRFEVLASPHIVKALEHIILLFLHESNWLSPRVCCKIKIVVCLTSFYPSKWIRKRLFLHFKGQQLHTDELWVNMRSLIPSKSFQVCRALGFSLDQPFNPTNTPCLLYNIEMV